MGTEGTTSLHPSEKLVREALLARYGSIAHASEVLEIPNLKRYCSGKNDFPHRLLCDLAEHLGIPFRPMDWSHHAAFMLFLEDVPEPPGLYVTTGKAREVATLGNIRKIVSQVLGRVREKQFVIEPDQDEETLRTYFEDRLPVSIWIRAELREEWKEISKLFRRQNPGGIRLESHSLQRLARYLLFLAAIESHEDKPLVAAAYLRLFFAFPQGQESVSRQYGYVVLLSTLRKLEKLKEARALGQTVFAPVMQSALPNLKAFFLVTYGSVLSDSRDPNASMQMHDLCCNLAPESCWAGHATYNLIQIMAVAKGHYQTAVELAARFPVWEKNPAIKPYVQWLVAWSFAKLGHAGLAREKYREILEGPQRFNGKERVLFLLDYLEAEADPAVVNTHLRHQGMGESGLPKAIKVLSGELERANGPRVEKLKAIRSFCEAD